LQALVDQASSILKETKNVSQELAGFVQSSQLQGLTGNKRELTNSLLGMRVFSWLASV